MVKPRILHITTGLNVGGAERFLHTLLTGELRHDFDNLVISLMDLGHYGPLLQAKGVEVHTLGMNPGKPSFRSLVTARKLVRSIRPDLIQGWMYHGNLMSELVAGKTKTIWNIRQSLYDLGREKRGTQLVIRANRFLSRRPSKIVYNSELSRDQHEQFGFSDRSLVLSNGFSPEKWKPNPMARKELRRELGIPEEAPIVGYVGRYHPMKDIPVLLKACTEILDRDKKVHVVIVGRELTADNREIAPFFERMQMDRVHLLGQRSDIPDVMPAFDLSCLTSRWGEGFPNVIGEAMLCGVPCVSTDVGDASRVIGSCGKIVPSANPTAFAEAVLELLNMPAFERTGLGSKARDRISGEFSLKNITDHYRTLYTALLKEI